MRRQLLAACLTILPAAALAERVQIGDFWIDRTEVTIAQFRAFAQSSGMTTAAERSGGGYEYGAGWEQRPGWTYLSPFGAPGADDEPAVHVTWEEASAFCRASGGRLPTYEEWRTAAYSETRSEPGTDYETGRTYLYPVGDTPDGMNNNRERHVAVGTTKAGVNGLYDMGANVWEWLADTRGNDALTAGGSWWYGPENSQDGRAQWKPANFYALYVGFRCAYDAGQS